MKVSIDSGCSAVPAQFVSASRRTRRLTRVHVRTFHTGLTISGLLRVVNLQGMLIGEFVL